ncbi:cyclic nucleotide-binding domain-containing protein [Fuerstiella marisgermanici]|uniref:DNA-binding transcriptional dual regulator Crp n=1 Tax=Fuerstiella marisgermanici TaxID=1891926 RepID=A0A1P8WB47_9PLAN|nr:cyclic nucleotide-binding domain-containing protein [Fuerstiella marisgermanici]APZ91279.1 DNA-binding transcriptional dual regulator Crp [Fuerstiella marisgermanici]
MKISRYEYVTPESVSSLNRILRRGWRPVRESRSDQSAAESPTWLVLLEKECDLSPFVGDEIAAGVPVDFLQGVMLFDDFSDEEIRTVVNQCEIQSVAAYAELFNQGDVSEAIYVVLNGEVEVTLPELPVQGQSVVKLEPGGVFGESTFFSETPHTMSATAGESGATLLALDHVSFDEMFQAQVPAVLKLATNAARILAGRLQETDEWVWSLLTQSQQAQISASWRRYRHRVSGSGSDASGGFFGV